MNSQRPIQLNTLALVSLVLAVITCIAACAVVPEVRNAARATYEFPRRVLLPNIAEFISDVESLPRRIYASNNSTKSAVDAETALTADSRVFREELAVLLRSEALLSEGLAETATEAISMARIEVSEELEAQKRERQLRYETSILNEARDLLREGEAANLEEAVQAAKAARNESIRRLRVRLKSLHPAADAKTN